MAPTTCGNPHLVLYPFTTSLNPSLLGNFTYLGNRTLAITSQVSRNISPAVYLPMPNNAAKLLYSILVANLHTVIATLASTATHFLKDVSCRLI